MSKKKATVLGYTRAGHPVLLPTRSTPDAAQFVGWTRGDHVDASSILTEHGERETDVKVGSWCARWASAHAEITGKHSRGLRIRAAAETSIRSSRSRR